MCIVRDWKNTAWKNKSDWGSDRECFVLATSSTSKGALLKVSTYGILWRCCLTSQQQAPPCSTQITFQWWGFHHRNRLASTDFVDFSDCQGLEIFIIPMENPTKTYKVIRFFWIFCCHRKKGIVCDFARLISMLVSLLFSSISGHWDGPVWNQLIDPSAKRIIKKAKFGNVSPQS